MLASIAGIAVIFLIVGLIIAGVAGSKISTGKQNAFVPKNSVLHIKLDHPITENTSGNPLESFDFETFQPLQILSLRSIITSIEKASTDDRIKGIYLDLSTIQTGIASIEEIRTALENFKTSGKWIISYAEVYTHKSYYLASVADRVYLNPAGMMQMHGLASQIAFFKNALEKLDIDMQVIRYGKFKSAVEPFLLEKMSDENRAQMSKILHTLWGSMIGKMAISRNVSMETIHQLAENIAIRSSEDAVSHQLVDQLKYKDEILAELRDSLGIEQDKTIKSVAIGTYANTKPNEKANKKVKKEEIALIYANGDIVSGKSEEGTLGSETVSKAIRESRLDEDIKAIVLRVNSPGGSALASDVIWREVLLAKKVKPVIVSMGDVAASGGYYIACAADKIFASEKTITGSIGVFGVIPNAKGFFNNKLGITFDTVKTNKHADIMTFVRPLTNDEKSIIQSGVNQIYDDFITKVAEGRGMTKEQVDSIGQGRVWAGKDALAIGLVDEIGGMEEAIQEAKEMAGIEAYKLVTYPKKKGAFQMLFNISTKVQNNMLKKELGAGYKYYKQVQRLKNKEGVLMLMPFEIETF